MYSAVVWILGNSTAEKRAFESPGRAQKLQKTKSLNSPWDTMDFAHIVVYGHILKGMGPEKLPSSRVSENVPA